MILQGRLPDTQVPHTPNTTQDTMLKKTHTSLPTVLPVKGKLHVPAYTRGTKGQETEEAEPKCERPPLRPLHGGSGSTVSDPPHASQPCAANEEWVYLRAQTLAVGKRAGAWDRWTPRGMASVHPKYCKPVIQECSGTIQILFFPLRVMLGKPPLQNHLSLNTQVLCGSSPPPPS